MQISLYIYKGSHGTRKSTIAALMLSHFGNFNRNNFPCSFRDTLNSIEKKAFIAKDTINVIDDYNPEVVGSRKLEIMEKIYATYGDRTGRTRMSQDGRTLKLPYVARGLGIVTGETIPDVAQSRIARSLIINIKQDSIDLQKLSQLQNNAEKLSFCMMKFIEWIIQNEDKIRSFVKTRFYELRNSQNNNVHGRTSEIANVLTIGFNLFTEFLLYNNVIENSKKIELDTEANNVLAKLVEKQHQEIVELKPTEMFYNALEQLFATNSISVYDYKTGETYTKFSESGNKVGYYDRTKNLFYFLPDVIYGYIENFYASKDKKFPINDRALWSYLDEEGSLYRTDKRRFTVQRKINNQTYSVVAIYPRKNKELECPEEDSVIWDKNKRDNRFQITF